MNDDLVKGKSGFPPHPHRDYEIFSYVVDGKLSHQDSMGNKEALGRGSVQYMSAGRGVVHSEMNEERETCRFIQASKQAAPEIASVGFALSAIAQRVLATPLTADVDQAGPQRARPAVRIPDLRRVGAQEQAFADSRWHGRGAPVGPGLQQRHGAPAPGRQRLRE